MNYKIISMDFDGTLLTSNKNVTDTTKQGNFIDYDKIVIFHKI